MKSMKKPTWATITKDSESGSITYSNTSIPVVIPVVADTSSDWLAVSSATSSSDLTLTPSPGGTWEWMRVTAPTVPTPTTTTWATSLSINPIEMGELPDVEALAASGEFDTKKGRADFVRSFGSYLDGMYFTTSSRLMERVWTVSSSGTTPSITYRPDFTTSSGTWEIEYGGTTLPVKSGSITYDPESGTASFSGTTSVYRNDGTYAGECMVEVPRISTTVTESAGSTTLVATATPISSST